ncbi:Deoxynucleotidyltransferase terminal-interacting protein 2 [Blomia tropicalis]|nr:Deoxynucleotidyltransferase terminal-interacting protein 2 [Blomia tropicalis]
MFYPDSESDRSSISTSTQSSSFQHGCTSSFRISRGVTYQINTGLIRDDQYENITNRYLSNSENLKTVVSTSIVTEALEKLKLKTKDNSKVIVCDIDSIELTSEDLALRSIDLEDENKGKKLDDTKSVENEFEKYYGTSIVSCTPADKLPYIEFNLTSSEVQSKLDSLLLTDQSRQLATKSTLAGDIEKQFTIAPYRISRRKKKAEKAKDKRCNFTPMEKDLEALKMRRVWNPKNFYKKNSTILDSIDGKGTTKHFQIGTVIESHSDFYSDRLTKKERKQTIVDELMHDQELRAYNKRKLKYAMAKNTRLRMIMNRAKQRRAKNRIRQRTESRYNKSVGSNETKTSANVFKTYDF